MKRLLTKGRLEYVPSCPEAGAGGEFVMEGNTRRVRCTRHGNRALPWPSAGSYELHFNEFERRASWCPSKPRQRGIGTLRAYLARD